MRQLSERSRRAARGHAAALDSQFHLPVDPCPRKSASIQGWQQHRGVTQRWRQLLHSPWPSLPWLQPPWAAPSPRARHSPAHDALCARLSSVRPHGLGLGAPSAHALLWRRGRARSPSPPCPTLCAMGVPLPLAAHPSNVSLTCLLLPDVAAAVPPGLKAADLSDCPPAPPDSADPPPGSHMTWQLPSGPREHRKLHRKSL